MDIEHKQAEIIDHFVKQASIQQEGSSLANLLVEATYHPSLFAFSEILSVPNIYKLEGTEYNLYLALLRLFAYGTFSDYRSNMSCLPTLSADQLRKLKQLTVLTLAEANKELEVSNVRELEDFLINDCMYVGIVRGKLDQLRRSFEVQFAAGRDLRPDQLNNMIHTLKNWLGTSDNILRTIQAKINWADAMNEAKRKHQKEIEEKVEDAKKSYKKLHTLSRPKWTYGGLMRSSIPTLEEMEWTMKRIVHGQKETWITQTEIDTCKCPPGEAGESYFVAKEHNGFIPSWYGLENTTP